MASLLRHPAGSATVRHLHLIDIENLGVETPRGPVVAGTGELYRQLANPGRFDQFFVGADAARIFDVEREFPGVRRCAGRGPDGGEASILNLVDLNLVEVRFDAITIASGDGYFAAMANAARSRGLWLRVISRPERLSRKLRYLANQVISFPAPALWRLHHGDGMKGRHAA